MNLQPVTAPVLQRKEALCDAQRWDDPLLRPAYAFARADAVLIGAPYWDLSFPAALKIWVENIYVRNLTFRYTPEGEPVGLAQGKQAVYITTAGSPVGENDWGAGYMRAVLTTLGIPEFRSIRAEGIDIQAGTCRASFAGRSRRPARWEQRWARPWRQPLDAEKRAFPKLKR